ncbi:protein of unknown function [Cupriavidus taiwanensis]|nr:protein of unknown function [Cupriavidus taiwanensis]
MVRSSTSESRHRCFESEWPGTFPEDRRQGQTFEFDSSFTTSWPPAPQSKSTHFLTMA